MGYRPMKKDVLGRAGKFRRLSRNCGFGKYFSGPMDPRMRRSVLGVLAAILATTVLTASTRAAADTPSTPGAAPATSRMPVSALKIMNYYPSSAGWMDMWTDYSHATTVSDFAAIQSLNANTVRIIVQPSAVGYPVVNATMRANLDDMINVATSAGLKVQLTLFDMWANYSDVAGSEQWVQSLLDGETSNPAIALVELKNEMPINSTTVSWADALLPFLQTLLPGVPRTISEPGSGGLSAIQSLLSNIPPSDLDAVDVHYYGDAALAAGELEQVQRMAGSLPVFIGETGISTYGTSPGEEAQTRFYEVLGQTAKDLGLPPPSPWMLNDVTQAAGENLTTQQEYFGLRRADGSWKPAALVVSQVFSGLAPRNWDGTMVNEALGLAPVLGAWTEFDPAAGTPTINRGLAYLVGQSLCFSGTGGSSAKWPSVEQSFPVLVPNESFSVTGWIHRNAGNGYETIAIAGFNASDQFVGETDSVPAVGSGYWQKLTVAGVVPPGITSVQVHLKAGAESGTACWSNVTINSSAP
jgi:hypothetical protein